MSDYQLTLLIDQAVLAYQSSDSFCIAKKGVPQERFNVEILVSCTLTRSVGETFTTVFSDGSVKPKRTGQKSLLSSNDFKWKDQFRVYATADYTVGQLVHSATNQVPIAFGQQSIFQNSEFGRATPADHGDFPNPSGSESYEDSFLLKSVPHDFHAAVDTLVEGKWAPIYVDPDMHAGAMNISLTPLNSYLVFWDDHIQTASMISTTKLDKPYNFSFDPNKFTKTIRYGFAIADQPSPEEEPAFY